MPFDWFTVGAQALNFLILVWLLKRFLYKPILHAIDEREKRIASELADADAKKTEAHKERDEFRRKNNEFDQQHAAILKKASDEAQAQRQRLLEEARKSAEAWNEKRQETLKSDARNLSQAISRRAQQEVLAISRKALKDLASSRLEEQIAQVFCRRVRELGGEAKGQFAEAMKTRSDGALIRSSFDLPETERATIQTAVNEAFETNVQLRFETSPDVICGIEFSANGRRLAWSIANYLASLEEGIEELLNSQQQDKTKANTNAKPESPKQESNKT